MWTVLREGVEITCREGVAFKMLGSRALPSRIRVLGDCGGVTGSSSFSSTTGGGSDSADEVVSEVLPEKRLSPLTLSESPLEFVRRRLTTLFRLFLEA